MYAKYKNFGGVLSDQNKISKKLKLEEEDSSIKEYSVYGAECVADDPIRVSLSNIGPDDDPDYVLAISQEGVMIVLRYTWKDTDNGNFLMRQENSWVDMTVLHMLNIATATELIAQNGLPWTPISDENIPYEVIKNALSVDEE